MFKLLVSLFAILITTLSFSQAGTFEPYVKTGIIHESNLFLTTNDDEAQELLNIDDRSDTRLEFSPGIRGEVDYQRQKFLIDLSVLRKDYDEFDTLDFTGGEARAVWDWLYGNKWDGRAAYRYTDKQSNFNERLTIDGDSSEIHQASLTANRKLNPRYTLLSGIGYKTNDYKRRDVLSKDDTDMELGVRYTSRADNTVDLVYKYVDSEYPERGVKETDRGLDDGFEDKILLTRINWQLSGKSFLDIEAGFTDRSQDNVTENDFDGLIGSAVYHWALSEKTRLISSIWRDLRDSEDQLTNFVEVEGIGLELNWDTTAKITSYAKLELENRDFQSNGLVSNGPTKKDDYFNASLGLNYSFKDNIIITADYAYEERDSNIPTREYDNNVFTLYLDVGF